MQIPLAKDVASKSEKEGVGEEEVEKIKVDLENEAQRTLPINENKKTLIRR